MSERELLAVLADVMIRRGGEYLATNTVCSGPNTNPWRAEATDRRLELGDLVYVDTDTVGIEGISSASRGRSSPATRLRRRRNATPTARRTSGCAGWRS